ncbi:TetR family transcriptional regulator [Actinocrinis puniceicyclus]|uniref:TetR family transcriptional regulator n=1 Tax=Actinocrinis puniceicyclus TaxID=977794 RepID=A0A8J7WPP3_9ACTN|nr:TetR family transcriptional regulator [Actinocrinis puniceicyclus]
MISPYTRGAPRTGTASNRVDTGAATNRACRHRPIRGHGASSLFFSPQGAFGSLPIPGPAATSIAAIAERAGVTRLTVYRHFPHETTLFQACSGHWLSQQTLPRPQDWARSRTPPGG